MVTNDFDTYVEKYIEGYLFSDLGTIINDVSADKHPGNLAYMFMTALCSAMEFNGLLLQKGDPVKEGRVDASTGFGHYVKHYLEKIDPNYAVIRELGPRLIRNGIAHAYATKGRVAITRVGERKTSHLIRYTTDETLVINANYLYEDFKRSYMDYAKPKMITDGELRERVISHYESIRNVYKEEVEKARSESRSHLEKIPWLHPDIQLDHIDEDLEQNGSPILVS